MDLQKMIDTARGWISSGVYVGSKNFIDVYLNKKDFDEAWKVHYGAVNTYNSTSIAFTDTILPTVYLNQREPDYEFAYSYYYFDLGMCVSDYGSNYGAEIFLLQKKGDDWFKVGADNIPSALSGIVVAEINSRNNKDKSIETTCWHSNKKAVYLFVSAYWLCENCGKDCGTLNQDDFYKELRGKK